MLKDNSLGDLESFGKNQVIDINQVNLLKYLYTKPKLSMLIEHVFSAKQQLIFEPPFD